MRKNIVRFLFVAASVLIGYFIFKNYYDDVISSEDKTTSAIDNVDSDTTGQIDLGVIVRNMTKHFADQKQIRFIPGLYVEKIVDECPAANGAFKTSDIIMRVNSITVNTTDELSELLKKERSNKSFEVVLMRDDSELKINLKVDSGCTLTDKQRKILYILGLQAM